MSTNLAQVDIFNMALIQLGAATVSSPTDNSKNARTLLAIYDFVRMSELRKPPYWNFAIGMAQLAVSSTPPLFDRAYAYALPADYLMLADNFPESNYNDKDWLVQKGYIYTNGSYWYPQVNASLPTPQNIFTFTISVGSASQGAIYTNNGQVFTVLTTVAGGTTLSTQGSGSPAVSGTLVLISGSGDATLNFSSVSQSTVPNPPNPPPPGPLNIRYVQNITDTTQFDPLFAQALAMRMAYRCADALVQSNAKKKEAAEAYKDTIDDARKANSFEDVSAEFMEDTYWTARL